MTPDVVKARYSHVLPLQFMMESAQITSTVRLRKAMDLMGPVIVWNTASLMTDVATRDLKLGEKSRLRNLITIGKTSPIQKLCSCSTTGDLTGITCLPRQRCMSKTNFQLKTLL
jgi:hypothetical protein